MIETDSWGTLICPKCQRSDGTHVDTVWILARDGEDAEPRPLRVDGAGQMSKVPLEQYPVSSHGLGRRHEFVLGGWCELCGGFWHITFHQHKGQTLVEVQT